MNDFELTVLDLYILPEILLPASAKYHVDAPYLFIKPPYLRWAYVL